MAKLKIGRRIFDIDDEDVVMSNGACWQLTTQRYFDGRHYVTPVMSKIMCEKFVKKNILIHFKTTDEYVTAEGKKFGFYYYKFDTNKLEEFLSK